MTQNQQQAIALAKLYRDTFPSLPGVSEEHILVFALQQAGIPATIIEAAWDLITPELLPSTGYASFVLVDGQVMDIKGRTGRDDVLRARQDEWWAPRGYVPDKAPARWEARHYDNGVEDFLATRNPAQAHLVRTTVQALVQAHQAQTTPTKPARSPRR